jgi:hypothetical protein
MIRRTLAALILAVLGLFVGLSFASDALAWSPGNLPPGWSTDHVIAVNAPSCPSAYRIHTATAGVFSDPICEDSPTYQADFDAYVDAHYTPPAPPAPPPTTTAASTTTPATTTAPATTDVTTTAPAVTATDPVTTQPAPAPPTPTDTTTTATATVATTDPVIANLQAQIDALHAELSKLVCLLQMSKTLDPGILAALMSMDSCS